MECSLPALNVRDLSFSYGRNAILRGISFSVPSCSVCGLLGPNGSGKTTLFRCCLGLLEPGSGEILIQERARPARPAALARLVAYVPQEHRQAFPFSVRELVRMGRTPHLSPFSRLTAADEERVEAALALTGMNALADQPCNRLSGGQRQLALIARAVAQDTPLLLLDEPTSALDFNNQIIVWKLLRSLAGQGKTILVCCHDPNHILWFCHHVIALHEGELLAQGPPAQTLSRELLHTLYGPCCDLAAVGDLRMVCPGE